MSNPLSPIKKEDTIKEERIKVIDMIIELYPDLKKDRDSIILTINNKTGKPYNYIFTKFIHNNDVLYYDPQGMILDKNLVFKGVIIDNVKYIVDDYVDYIDIEKYDLLFGYTGQNKYTGKIIYLYNI